MAELENSEANQGKYGQMIDTVAKRVSRHGVALVTDVHHETDLVHSLAIDVAKRNNSTLALEVFFPDQQIMIDALANGQITRQDFLRVFKTPDVQTADANGGISGYIGADRANRMMEKLADSIASGTKVLAIGSYQGMEIETSDKEGASRREAANKLLMIAERDSTIFVNAHEDKLRTNPVSFLRDLRGAAEKGLSGVQDEKTRIEMLGNFTDVSQSIERDLSSEKMDVLKDKAKQFVMLADPNYQSWWEKDNRLIEEQAKFSPEQREAFSKRVVFERQKIDGSVAEQLDKYVDAQGPVVAVYGILHTLTAPHLGLNPSGGIDTHLRNMGRQPVIIDVETGNAGCSGEEADCKKNKSIKSAFHRAARDENDPYRYTVNMDAAAPDSHTLSPLTRSTGIRNVLDDIRHFASTRPSGMDSSGP